MSSPTTTMRHRAVIPSIVEPRTGSRSNATVTPSGEPDTSPIRRGVGATGRGVITVGSGGTGPVSAAMISAAA